MSGGKVVQILNDHETVNELVIKNYRLVYHVIKSRFISDYMNIDNREELFSVGVEGLIKACQYFDKSKGFEFATYASKMIHGYIQRYKREKANTIKLSRQALDVRYYYSKLSEQGKNSDEIIDEIVRTYKIPYGEVIEAIDHCVTSFDQPIGTDGDGHEITVEETLYDDSMNIENNLLSKIEYEEKLQVYKRVLNAKQYKVLELMLSGKLKQRDLSKAMGVSQGHISRVVKFITEIVAPAVNSYYDGEISYSTMKTRIKKKSTSNYKSSANNKGGESIMPEQDIRKQFDTQINILKGWAISNPYQPVKINNILKLYDMNIPNGYSSRVKTCVEDELIKSGYKIEHSSRPGAGGYDIMVVLDDKDKNSEATEEKPIVTIKNLSTEKVSIPNTQSIQITPSQQLIENVLFTIKDVELSDTVASSLGNVIGALQNLTAIKGSKAKITVTISEEIA